MNKALALLYSRHCLCHFHSKSTACRFNAQQRREFHRRFPGNPHLFSSTGFMAVEP
jgi:hypothetical protein